MLCVVVGCVDQKEVVLVSFPKDAVQHKKWVDYALRKSFSVSDITDRQFSTEHSTLCSLFCFETELKFKGLDLDGNWGGGGKLDFVH